MSSSPISFTGRCRANTSSTLVTHLLGPEREEWLRELEKMGIKLMVSVWPTIDRNSSHFTEMREKGLLVRSERA